MTSFPTELARVILFVFAILKCALYTGLAFAWLPALIAEKRGRQ